MVINQLIEPKTDALKTSGIPFDLSDLEQKRVTDLFSIFIKIDQRLKAKERNENQLK